MLVMLPISLLYLWDFKPFGTLYSYLLVIHYHNIIEKKFKFQIGKTSAKIYSGSK